ncbi:ulp1 protease family protein [Coprinopsis cinerea okayama7|uniref:Ulp1 protease family protein n=1 Tax=Coprinopsis cinerea (strain Okayama-7 / 130 / ATCC MYA-4618 / FGSC 9003) TaxID=240176 RepID=A8NW00_COPC7|nr:ulp1 protease family protein [Coprinopsis cinerea okayama7\|eukprot:XP_001836791.2 ulp1 protease family protein [Coprinopsis cinerea okayama7\
MPEDSSGLHPPRMKSQRWINLLLLARRRVENMFQDNETAASDSLSQIAPTGDDHDARASEIEIVEIHSRSNSISSSMASRPDGGFEDSGSSLALSHADEVEMSVYLRDSSTVFRCGGQTIAAEDLGCLLPGKRLNDEVINFYAALINRRSQESTNVMVDEEVLNAYCFNTFFYTKLERDGYHGGRLFRWIKFDLFSKDIILIPIHCLDSHWSVSAINLREKRFEFYDSMGLRPRKVFDNLRSFMAQEHYHKKQHPFDFSGWVDFVHDGPEQENDYDCGVFASQALQALSRRRSTFNFAQNDMHGLRQRMILEIGRGKLWNDLLTY